MLSISNSFWTRSILYASSLVISCHITIFVFLRRYFPVSKYLLHNIILVSIRDLWICTSWRKHSRSIRLLLLNSLLHTSYSVRIRWGKFVLSIGWQKRSSSICFSSLCPHLSIISWSWERRWCKVFRQKSWLIFFSFHIIQFRFNRAWSCLFCAKRALIWLLTIRCVLCYEIHGALCWAHHACSIIRWFRRVLILSIK